MINCIRASIYKMFHDRKIVLCFLGTALWTLTVIVVYYVFKSSIGMDVSQLTPILDTFLAGHPIELPLILTCSILFSSEFRDRSWTMLLSKGISKKEYYFAKFTCAVLLAASFTLISFIVVVPADILISRGGAVSSGYFWELGAFIVGQILANAVIASFMLCTIIICKRGEVPATVNAVFMVMGYPLMHKVEQALGLGETLTNYWIYSLQYHVNPGMPHQWGVLLVSFVLYLILFSLISLCFLYKRDAE